MPRKGSKDDAFGDVPLTLSLLREELSCLKKQLNDELKSTLKKELIEELTSSITNIFRSEIQELKERVKQLSQENERLKADHAGQLEELVEEANRRYQKRKNIIISNLPETLSGSVQDRKKDDRNLVQEVAKELDLLPFDIKEVQRIGKIDSKRPRLLCVTCSDESSKHNLLRSGKHLRNSRKFKHCYINPDMTLIQRENNRKLRKELNEKRQQSLDVVIRNGRVVLRQDLPASGNGKNFHQGF